MNTGWKCIVSSICGAVLLSGSLAVHAAEKTRPSIVHARLFIDNELLVCDVASTGLFPERIIGTVRSGLPAVVELFFHVTGPDDDTVAEGVRSYSLGYDVWEGVYSITENDSTIIFPSFQSMRRVMEQLRNVTLVPVHSLVPAQSYNVRLSLAVNPLQGTDRRTIDSWVRENVRRSRDDSWKEQVLNVNEMIAHFFSRNTNAGNRSKWYHLARFRPDALPVRDTEVR